MRLDNMILTDFAAAVVSPINSNGEQTTRGTITSVDPNDDKNVEVLIDGTSGGQPTAATTMVKCSVDDRVMVLIKNHKATVIGNISSPVLKKVTANDIEAGAVTAESISGTWFYDTDHTSWINLKLGTFNLDNKLIWNGTNLTVNGTLTAGAGSMIGVGGNEYKPILHAPSTITGSTKAFTVAVKPNGQNWTYPFSVTYDGSLTSTKGTIGGWSIGTNNISTTNTSGNYVTLSNGTNTNQDILVVRTGAGTTASPYVWPFYLRATGELVATNATVTGTVTANNGRIAGFTIDGNSLKNGNYIDLCAYMSSGGYSGARLQLGPGTGAHSSLSSNEFAIWNSGGVESYINPTGIYSGGTLTCNGAMNVNNGHLTVNNGHVSSRHSTDAYAYAYNTTTTCYAACRAESGGNHGLYSNGYWNGSNFVSSSARYLVYRNTAGNTIVPSELYTHNEGYTTLRPVVGTNSGSAAVGVVVSSASNFGIYARWGAGATAAMSGRTISCPSSDIRLKENVEDSTVDALSVINAIKIRQFDWKDKSRGHWDCGMVVDEMEKDIDPKFCIGGEDEEDGTISYKSVDTFYLQGYEVKAIQELSARIEELERRLNE